MKSLLVFLVRLFPESFRAQFGAGMADHLTLDYTAARSRGRAAAFWFTITSGADLIAAAIAERWSPAWTPAELANERNRTMTWTSNEWARDIRHAWRSLRRTPGFLITAVATLGLAIGVNAGMFSVVDTVLLRPLPYAHMDRLVFVAASAPGSGFPDEFGVSPEFFVEYRDQSHLLESVATYNTFTATLRVGDRVERVPMSAPSNSLFATLGAQPIRGRLPAESDDDRVTVISYALWKTWFGRDSTVVGRSFDVAGVKRTVIGIMGPEFRFPDDATLLWFPGEIHARDITAANIGRFGIPLVGRMAPGATPAAVADELTRLARRVPERFGGGPRYAKIVEQHRAIVRPLDQELLGAVARPIWVLLGAVVIVLMIACANVANLFLVRAEGRQRELAVRRAIGAARSQLVRLQMSEALLVAALGGVLAVALAAVTLPAFLHAAPAGVPRLSDAGLGMPTILYTLIAALISACACGAVPAIRASAPDLSRLREGGRGSTHRRQWARNGLVIGQTALALVLLIGSGLLVRSFRELRHVDPGYSTRDIFTFQIAPENANLTDGPSFARFDLAFIDRLRALPGVQSVGLVENVPLDEHTGAVRMRTEDKANDPNGGPLLRYTYTAGDYFRTMGIRVLAGRVFDNSEELSSVGHAILSKSAANVLWPGENPVGKRFHREGDTTWATVVGVVNDVLQSDFRGTPDPLVYLPLVGPTPNGWIISSPAYVVKTTRAEYIAPEIRALVHQIAPEAPMYRVFTMAQLARRSMVQLSFTMLTLGVASLLALVLGAVGLYGVLSYVVAERTREIGVRMALGARAEQVRRMVVVQGARVVGAGVVIGLAVAIATTRALHGLLYGVAAIDVGTFVGMSASMLAVGALASYVPARRASNVDPIESLRGE